VYKSTQPYNDANAIISESLYSSDLFYSVCSIVLISIIATEEEEEEEEEEE